MNFLKKAAALGLACVMGLGVLTGCGQSIPGSKTVTTVNDEAMSLGTLAFYVRYQQAEMSAWTSYMSSGGIYDQVYDTESGQTYGQEMCSEALTELEDYMLVRQHAEEAGQTLTDEETAEIEAVADAYISENDADVRKKVGASKEDLVNLLSLMKTKSKMLDYMAEGVDENVTEEESAQTSITVTTIRIDEDNDVPEDLANEKAQEILEALQSEKDVANADMNAIAEGILEASATSDFNFTTSDSSDSSVNSAILEAVSGLQAGELVDHVIEGADNDCLYICRVNTLNDPEATQQKVTEIIDSRKNDLYSEKVEEWRNEGTITRNDKVLEKLTVTDSENFLLGADPEESDSTAAESAAESEAAESTAESAAESLAESAAN